MKKNLSNARADDFAVWLHEGRESSWIFQFLFLLQSTQDNLFFLLVTYCTLDVERTWFYLN